MFIGSNNAAYKFFITFQFFSKLSFLEGQIPKFDCPLDPYLTGSLPVEIEDPSVPSLILLRALYGLNRYWWCLYDDEDIPPTSHAPLLPNTYV